MCPQVFIPLVTKFVGSTIGKTILTSLATGLIAKKLQGPRPTPPPTIIPKQNTPYQRQQGPAATAALGDEDIRPEDEDIKLAAGEKTRKKLERKQKGVKGLAAVEPAQESAPMGINPGSYA
tara:strand:- start:93 stop:455 length:363 start_codon:yes stop_codon:yes gene_type:complete